MNHYFSRKWSYFENKYFHISITNPFSTMNKVTYIFKKPKLHFKIIKRINNFPFFFCSPRAKIFDFQMHDVMWKDKYDTPRCEGYPQIHFTLFNTITFLWYWQPNDDYWEQVLWYLHYYPIYSNRLCNRPNIFLAEKNWPWIGYPDNKSTWNRKYQKKYENLYRRKL